jgi:L-threonylcarbamoyladenylate synthase
MSVVSIDQAVKLLKDGTPVALPTETVYGLAAPIDQPEALNAIFQIKKRPLTDPLIVHVSSIEMAKTLFLCFDEDLEKLANHFWPGPLTLVAKKNKKAVSDLITSGFETVAVRMPSSQIFKEIIEKVGSPLAAPSANLFKKVSPTSADHILETLPGVNVVDGGSSEIGIESTIYDVKNRQILRPGDTTHEQIEAVLGYEVSYTEKDFTPGSEKEHYRPNIPVHVFENRIEIAKELGSKSVELVLSSDPKTAAKNFYKDLRSFDHNQHEKICIYFDPLWIDADWNGLKNRLLKTASKWKTAGEK